MYRHLFDQWRTSGPLNREPVAHLYMISSPSKNNSKLCECVRVILRTYALDRCVVLSACALARREKLRILGGPQRYATLRRAGTLGASGLHELVPASFVSSILVAVDFDRLSLQIARSIGGEGKHLEGKMSIPFQKKVHW